uniref:Peptidase S1 domain-containing protein n=1 Tax=Calidris pygmaea TaxID=425635 RepID=A0A8C3KQU6_9CHAR
MVFVFPRPSSQDGARCSWGRLNPRLPRGAGNGALPLLCLCAAFALLIKPSLSQPTNAIPGSRIVGGQDAVVGSWPWAVSLQLRRPGNNFAHVCGGVLVNENSVLTAGHCVTGREYVFMLIAGHTVKRKIRSITVHPEFKRETFENDIALFALGYAVRYSGHIQPICLPPAELPPGLENGTECFISGWGRTSEQGTPSPVLREAQVEIIPYSTCNGSESYGGLVNRNMICAGSRFGEVDACQGDSGGPLACYHAGTNKYYLMGISSFGLGCGRPAYPGIYVRLTQYRAWITSELLSSTAGNPVSIPLTVCLTLAGMVLV